MINEDHGHTPTPDAGRIEISDASVRVRINDALKRALDWSNNSFVTPYVAIERVRKALTQFHIFLPGVTFLEGNEGSHIFDVHQFGFKLGQHENGRVITKDDVEYVIEFSWRSMSCGGYHCSAELKRVEETTD
jgi:hypothetical protein